MTRNGNEFVIPSKPLLKAAEVARILNVSRAFVYQLMDRGELSYVKLGAAFRIKAEDVTRLIENGTSTAKMK